MDTNLTLMQISALAVAGMCHALLGSVKVPLARKMEIDEARVGGLVSVFGFTLIPMVFAAGFLVDLIGVNGKQAVIGGGFLVVIASLIMLARLKTYPVALMAVLLLGIGWSALVNVLNVTSPPAFLPEEEMTSRISYAMNMGDFIFGMGAFLTPLLVAGLVRWMRFEAVFLVLAALALIPLLQGLGVDWVRIYSEPSDSVAGGLSKLADNPIVWLCCLAFFCHVPIEAATATWATTLMTERDVAEGKASGLLSAFWLTFMGSRLATALLLPAGQDAVLVIVMSVLCIAFTLGLVLSRGAKTTCVMIIAAGLILGPIFPTLIAILLTNVEAPLHGRAVGVFFAVGGIGWTAVPMLIGYCAKRSSVQRAFLVATGCAVLLTALSVALYYQHG
jgi:fucose permease